MIAICDHNASENVKYVLQLAERKPLTVLPGMEVTSREEVHLLALFDRLDLLLQLQTVVYHHLPGQNDENLFGCQVIVNERDEVEGMNQRLLIGATQLSLQEIIDQIHALGGLAIACHIDRDSYSVISQLGFVDEGIPFDALEISHSTGIKRGRLRFPELSTRPFVESSDAHFIRDIGQGFTEIFLEAGTISELKMAFEKMRGRYIRE
jgi:predicted metal-dependent phosphoesterase TrpH